jgi:hypothetical protein
MNEILLQLLKLDLGITHNLRDVYFSSLLTAAQNELTRMGVDLTELSMDDQMLIVDYAVWTYRKRQENIPLSRNIQYRIHNRIIQKAGAANAES